MNNRHPDVFGIEPLVGPTVHDEPTTETAAKEHAYAPVAAPNSTFHRLRRLWRERVVPEWRERWNSNVTNAANHLTSMKVDVEKLELRRAKPT